MSPFRGQMRTIGALAVILIGLVGPARAQVTLPPTPTQDQQFRLLLGLGDSDGCVGLLFPELNPAQYAGVDQLQSGTRLQSVGDRFGNELRAICGPSAVNSASSLGGSLGTVQPTKTATQYDVARGRLDQRLKEPPKGKPSKNIGFALGGFQPSPSLSTFGELPGGVGLFGGISFDQRDRADTPFESGFDSDVREVTVGLDFVRGRGIVGGFFERAEQEADFTSFSPLLPLGVDQDTFASVLQDPSVLTRVCGGLSDGGTFEHKATRVGGFAGWGVGGPGFVDASFGWARREHDYARNVCTIEAQGPLTFDPLTGRLFSGTTLVDDIFAGAMTGLSKSRETTFSVRTGANIGNDVITVGPRATLTMVKVSTDAFVELGRSTVANDVVPVDPGLDPPLPTIRRTLGGPIGFELAVDEQSRTSVAFEAGAEIGFHLGPLVPHVAGYWRREFKDDVHVVSARFAQDLRATPTTFEFGNDGFDRDTLVTGFGVTALAGDRVTARVAFTKLHADDIFNSKTFSAHVRVRF
jgi:hypothetical protein